MIYIYRYLGWIFKSIEGITHKIECFFYTKECMVIAGTPKFSIGDKVICKDSTAEDYYHQCEVMGKPKIDWGSQGWIYLCKHTNHGHQFNYKQWALEKA